MPHPSVWIVAGGVLGLLAVALGAFAAHGLEAAGDARAVALVDKAARYQMTHALALGLCGVLGLLAGPETPAGRWAGRAAGLFLAGVVLFCGALYGIALFDAPIGAVAPFGGTAFMIGWGFLVVAGVRLRAIPAFSSKS